MVDLLVNASLDLDSDVEAVEIGPEPGPQFAGRGGEVTAQVVDDLPSFPLGWARMVRLDLGRARGP